MDGSMTPRMDLNATLPEGYKAVIALDRAAAAGVDPTIGELVKVRASMLNGCAFCLDMHTTDAVGAGEDLRRLMAVVASGRVDLKPLVTHRFRLDDIEAAYDLFSHQRDGVLKVAITP